MEVPGHVPNYYVPSPNSGTGCSSNFVKSNGRFHAVLYGTLDNIFYVFAHTNQEF